MKPPARRGAAPLRRPAALTASDPLRHAGDGDRVAGRTRRARRRQNTRSCTACRRVRAGRLLAGGSRAACAPARATLHDMHADETTVWFALWAKCIALVLLHVLPPTRARHISRISSSVIFLNAHDAFRPARTVRIAVPRLCTVEISSGLSAHSSVTDEFELAPSSRIAGATADASDATPVTISLSLGMSSTPISGA